MSVALTFDDGPNRGSTVKLLDLLDRLSVPVTFFVRGQMVEKNPRTLIRAASATVGHQIGNHSWSHPNFQRLADDEIKDQITRTQNLIVSTIGKSKASMLLRPPYGIATFSQRALIGSLGFQLIFWDVDPEDWKGQRRPTEIADYLLKNIADGNIVLLHDIHERTVEAMKILLPKLKAKFDLVTVGHLKSSPVHLADVETVPNAEQFTSRPLLCTTNQQSSKKILNRRTRNLVIRATVAFRIAVMTLLRGRSYLVAQYRRLRIRLSSPQSHRGNGS